MTLRNAVILIAVAATLAPQGMTGGNPSTHAVDDTPRIVSAAGMTTNVTVTRDEISLNGAWDFTPLDGSVNPGVKTTIRVPDEWDALPGFHDATTGVYERAVFIPASWSGRAVFLEIYEANWHVDLAVNGAVFPRVSEGIGIPTNVDVTSAVNFWLNNTFRVTVTQA